MGGMLTILVRRKNGEKFSFKTSTGTMKLFFDDSHVVDEVKFFDRLTENDLHIRSATNVEEHLDYDEFGALFAPYHYGLFMIDYLDNKIFACNNFCGFMGYFSRFLMFDLYHFYMGNVPIPVSELNMPIDPSEPIGHIDVLRIMRESNNCSVISDFSFAGNSICVNSFGDILRAILASKGIEFEESDVRSALNSYHEMHIGNFVTPTEYDVVITPKGWEVYVGDGTAEHVAKAYEHCKLHSLLTDLDEIAWSEYLEECREYESED